MGFVTSPSQQAVEKQESTASKQQSKQKTKLSASMVVRPEHIVTSEAQQEAASEAQQEAEALEQKGKK
jgi:hypothetical protein